MYEKASFENFLMLLFNKNHEEIKMETFFETLVDKLCLSLKNKSGRLDMIDKNLGQAVFLTIKKILKTCCRWHLPQKLEKRAIFAKSRHQMKLAQRKILATKNKVILG